MAGRVLTVGGSLAAWRGNLTPDPSPSEGERGEDGGRGWIGGRRGWGWGASGSRPDGTRRMPAVGGRGRSARVDRCAWHRSLGPAPHPLRERGSVLGCRWWIAGAWLGVGQERTAP